MPQAPPPPPPLWTVHFSLEAILILPEAGNEKLKNKGFFYVVITREKAKKNI